MFGVEDAYFYEEDPKYSPKTDIMRWYNYADSTMTKYDLIMVLRAFTYNKWQKWSSYNMKKVKN